MKIVLEKPKNKFNRLWYGVTIEGQTYWFDTKEKLNKHIEDLRSKANG